MVTHLAPQRELGSTVYVSNILRAIVNSRISVHLIILTFEKDFDPHRPLVRGLQIPGVTIDIITITKRAFPITLFRTLVRTVRELKRLSPNVLIIRNHWFSCLAWIGKRYGHKVVILHDGIVEELVFRKNGFMSLIHYLAGSTSEKLFFRCADWVLPVTAELANYERHKYKVQPYRQLVCPTPSADAFFSTPLRECPQGEPLRFIYVGSLDAWQEFEAGIDYLGFLRNHGFPLHFTVLTGEVEKAKSLLDRKGWRLSDYTVTKVPHTEVPTYMARNHFGIGLHKDGLVTKVCSPVKHVEYLASGLPVVISANISTMARLICQTETGMVIDPYNHGTWVSSLACLEKILANYPSISATCRKIAVEYYSMASVRTVIEHILNHEGWAHA